VFAIWLFRRFGECAFPGVDEAEIEYVDAGSEPRSDTTASEWEGRGVLYLGVGGGRFDEHPAKGNTGRKQHNCCATLVARTIGASKILELRRLLDWVLRDDTGIAWKDGKAVQYRKPPFDLSYFIGLLNQRYPDDSDHVLDWAFEALDAEYQKQVEFFAAAKDYHDADRTKQATVEIDGSVVTVISILSDNEQAPKFVRSQVPADIIIHLREGSGNCFVGMNQYSLRKKDVRPDDIAAAVRVAEEREAHGRIVSNHRQLRIEGVLPGEGTERWSYHRGGGWLLNGSRTAKDVPATDLSIDQVREAILDTLRYTAQRAAEV